MNGNRKADAVIIGGGASGLAAAVELGIKAPGLDVLVIEKMAEPGRKIRATGSGRCNISNTDAEGFSRIMRFFREIGLVTKTYENGLVYPYSESASDVADLLIERAESLGVRFACGEEVTEVKQPDRDGRFLVSSVYKDKNGTGGWLTEADFVILAAGGKAGPTFGTTGDGYRLAKSLGHSIVTPVPALTGIECSEWESDAAPCAIDLAGTRSRGRVSLYRDESGCFGDDTKVFEEEGEIQFTKYGLSGICVFNMTRCMRFDRKAGESLADFLITADLFPDGDIADFLRDRRENAFEGEKTKNVLTSVLKEDVAAYVIAAAACGLSDRGLGERAVAELTDDDTAAIGCAVHSLSFHPAGIRGWKDAQVTMGGVSLDEINEATSESLLVKGLYITGELADRDFRCGGFNLSNAWITGLAAADDIAR